MNILFTVCARSGSKGVKNKNIREFLGYPLIHYTLSAIDLFIKNNKEYDVDICVSSDGENIIDIANKFIKVESIKRPNDLSQDTTSKLLVIKHALKVMESRFDKKYDYIIDLDITSPLRTIRDIENALFKKFDKKDMDIVFSVVESRRNPSFNMVEILEDDSVKKIIDSDITARQQAKKTYDMNASIYVYQREFLLLENSKNIFDGKCTVIKMLDTAILDIDCENDFELMSVIAKYLYENNELFKEIRTNIINESRNLNK